jgi:hypothetical protein
LHAAKLIDVKEAGVEPSVQSEIAESSVQERLAGVLETRGADPQQQVMRRAFLSGIKFPARAHVLKVGCGTGVLTRVSEHACRVVLRGADDRCGDDRGGDRRHGWRLKGEFTLRSYCWVRFHIENDVEPTAGGFAVLADQR